MQTVIWGAGTYARRFAVEIGYEFDFFIDRDPAKSGNYLGKRILHPDQVENWNDLFIYIPFSYYGEVAAFLSEKGLKEGTNFKRCSFKAWISFSRAKQDFGQAMNVLETLNRSWEKSVLYVGIFAKSYANLYRKWKETKLHIRWASEEYSIPSDEMQKKVDADVFNMPILCAPNVFVKTWDERTGEDEKYIRQHPYLMLAAEQKASEMDGASKNVCLYQLVHTDRYIDRMLDVIRPSCVICFASIVAEHYILQLLCRQKGIPIIFTHGGVLPGTASFDIGGEMGESLPALYSEAFYRCKVSGADLDTARRVWEYLYANKVNRRKQPEVDCKKMVNHLLMKKKPIVFFAGQNDVESHMVPYTNSTAEYHSPIFKSSTEAAIFLANLCWRNEWNFIYKPHPQYAHPEQVSRLPDNTIFVEEADINDLIDLSDVTVTILSSTNYNALIRYKPVVMLGYNQTRGKGCTYEAFEKEKIEDTIKEALEKGFTKEQQDAFLKHIAQCLKYYLYDDLQDRPIRYGRPVPKSIDEFYELERLLKKEEDGGSIGG